MGLNLQIVALTFPEGTEFPGTMQELQDLIAQYLEIDGESNFSGINYGDVEPSADNRDRPWFKTDGAGNPIGWFSWNGLAWTPSPTEIQSGTTSQRPTSPGVGRLYFDTDIQVELIWNGSNWTTSNGSPGDIKHVRAATSADALTKNPGWSLDSALEGRVIAGASDGTGSHAYDSEVGAEGVTLVQSDLPIDGSPLLSGWAPYSGQFQNGPQGPGVFPIVTGQGTTSDTGPLNGGVTQTEVSVMQPTTFLWTLVKD